MARGWESKAVEDQIQEAEERLRRAAEPALDESPEARARRERLETLRLSRARTLDQLERATNLMPAYVAVRCGERYLRSTLTAEHI
ncbi:MAG: hypothetical protein LC747_03600 [Acidobacteria bacterium]|nr:hypothetical protein [Acidobacteriota bacterium]